MDIRIIQLAIIQTGMLMVLVIVPVFILGCGRSEKGDTSHKRSSEEHKSEIIQPKERPSSLPNAEQVNAVKQEARKRFEKALEKEPKFDFEGGKRKIFLKKYGLDVSAVPWPQKSRKQVEEIIEKLAKEAASLKFPESKRQRVIEQSEQEFPAFKRGDLVEVETRRGSIYGILKRAYPDKIKVEKFYILFDDIISPHWACFNKAECEKRRAHYVRVTFDIPKNDFEEKCKKRFAPNVFREQGYVFTKNNWVSADEIFRNEIRPEIAALEKEYNKNMGKKVREEVEKEMQQEGLQLQ